jgi:hypothetical protein
MRMVLSAPALVGPGGVQSYVLTVAPQLERLGHEVWLYAPLQGPIADEARERGLRMARAEADLPAQCDAIIAQDAATLLEMTGRYDVTRRVIVVHGAELDLHLPPAIDGLAHVAVALNDAVAARVAATAIAPTIVRLRQPIDVLRFRETPTAERPRRVLMLGNYLEGERRTALEAACAEMGLECRQVGLHGASEADPTASLVDADIVVGIGRSILDAMSCGRAAWVYSGPTGDGWVTPANYAALEADGFRGKATGDVLDAAAFRRDVDSYDPEMGRRNRALILLHHRAEEHAVQLVDAVLGARPSPPPTVALAELARLIRTRYDTEVRALQLGRDLEHERRVTERLANELGGAEARLRDADARRADAEGRLAALKQTRRWRAAGLAAQPLDLVRARARRR